VATAIGVAVLVGVVWWAVARAQGRAADLERHRDALEAYTAEVQSFLQDVLPAAQGLASIPARPPERARAALADEAKRWLGALARARTELSASSPPPALGTAQGLLSQSLALYESSVRAVRTAAQADGAVAGEVLARARDARDAGNSVWLSAVQLIDAERRDADLGPSGVGLPGAPAAGGVPVLPGGGGG
jgi:hypothetical protein